MDFPVNPGFKDPSTISFLWFLVLIIWEDSFVLRYDIEQVNSGNFDSFGKVLLS